MYAKKKSQADKSAIVAAQSQAFMEGTAVWVPLHGSDSGKSIKNTNTDSEWIRGVVQGVTRGAEDEVVLNINLENGEPAQYKASDCFLQNEKDDTVDDLVRSDFLHEPGILHTLRARYELDMIYTYSGQILIAVNPHKPLTHLYGERMMAQYKDIPFGDLSPHTYAVAEAAYSAMMIDEMRQSILISGESGAGKTESAKMVMQYLAHRSGASFGGSAIAAAPIEQQILESNPLLEAFGNAKTARNDNSSRFGKFVEIDFDTTGRITGASISTYLLERSRVVSIAPLERSFHIFYQLCSGSSEEMRKELCLPPSASEFAYLAQSQDTMLDGVDDADGFARTLNAMHVIGLDDNQIESVLKCVSAILHLGNIKFETADNATADEAIICPDASSTNSLRTAAELLGTSSEALQKALMSKIITIAGEKIEKRFTVVESIESRDSLSKSLYSRIFGWLVLAINKKIGSVGGGNRTNLSVGILDIYGFESFDTNSFEQLCINLANEKLQQAFNAHIFKAEQSEYSQEGIDWSYIDFIDNQDVLDILEGTCLSDITKENLAERNMGVFPMIDEACRLPRATPQGLATSLRSKLDSHPRFSAPKRDQYSFVINHYAGEVRYVVDHLLEKNRDFKVEDQESLMRHSNHPLPASLYPKSTNDTVRSSFRLNTIGSTFRTQLNALSENLSQCQPHFIRCIKPNESSIPGNLKPAYAMEQLRAGGVLEAVRIACAGYPTRKPFFPFVQRYSVLLSHSHLTSQQIPLNKKGMVDWCAISEDDVRELAKTIMKKTDLKGWQIGKTRIFLRTGQLAVLEGLRGALLTNSAIYLQKSWRGYIERKRFTTIINSVTVIQAAWKSYVERETLARNRRNHAASVIQAAWRMLANRRDFIKIREMNRAILIQSYWRMYLARKEFMKKSDFLQQVMLENDRLRTQEKAATTIQAYWRRSVAVKTVFAISQQSLKFKQLLEENEALKNELTMWRDKCSTLETELNFLKTKENTLKVHDGSNQEAQDTLQKQIRALRDELEAAYLREKISADTLIKNKDTISELQSDIERLKINSSAFEATIIGLQMKLAQAKTTNQTHEDTIADLKQSELSKTGEMSSLKLLIERIREENGILMGQNSEQETTISIQANEIAVMSSRIESLLGQISFIEGEKAELSKKISQIEADMITYSAGKKEESGGTGSSAILDSRTNVESENDTSEGQLDSLKSQIVSLYITSFINQKPIYVQIRDDKSNRGTYLPFSSWILRNCVNHWVDQWSNSEVNKAIELIIEALNRESQKNMTSCVNSINIICATGAMLKVDAVGTKDSDLFVEIREKLLSQTSTYRSFGAFISRNIPINVALLLAEDARRSARNNYLKQDSRNFADRLDVMGSSKINWKSIIGSLTNLSISLQEKKLPMPLVKSALWATMRYIDGSILNGILMRRDLCSVSSAKALLTALGILESYITSLPGGPEFCTSEYRDCFQRVIQAATFIIEGFNDCSRKARSGVGIRSSIQKCSALTLQQIYRLAESQHDDWLSGAFPVGSERKTLLEALKYMLEEPEEVNRDEVMQKDQTDSQPSWVMFDNDDRSQKVSTEHLLKNQDFHDLLVDPLADFNLHAKGFHRKQMNYNSKMYFHVSDSGSGDTINALESSFFSKLEETCSKVPMPEPISSCPQFQFLTN